MTIATESNSNNPLSNQSNLIFVNSNVDDYQSLVSHVDNAELIILDSTRDGVEQVARALANYSGVDSIHLISHGEVGTLQLGSTQLNADNLESYSNTLTSWSDSMSESADILLYGCSIGGAIAGVDLVNNLSQLTNADIAASNDLTGHNSFGGDWDLEVTTGPIEASSIYDASLEAYESVLAILDDIESLIDFDDFSDVTQLAVNGDAASVNGAMRLTSDEKKQKGSAFFDSALIISADTSFSTQFQFQISGGTNGADGFTFMLQNDLQGSEALGGKGYGGGLAYYGIEQSLAIEFDTYQNKNYQSDINNNHISVLKNGDSSVALAVADAPFDLNSGSLLNAWIDYDGKSDNLEIYLSDTANKPDSSLLSVNIELDAVVKEQAFLGFSSSTGGRANDHSILNWKFASDSKLVTLTPEQPETPEPKPMINFVEFNEAARLSINGNASLVNGAVALTPNLKDRSGSFFFDEPIRVKEDTSFSTQFQFLLGGGTGGAEGFTFMLQNDRFGDRALGDSGSGVGYRGISQSLAIEFDTYQGKGDPNDNHISILRNGDTYNALVNASSPWDLNGGQILNAWIDYDGNSDRLEVYLNDTANKPQTALVSTSVDLSDTVGDRARVGFSAATGGLSNTHELLEWTFNSSDRFAPEGDFSDLIEWPTVAVHAGLTPDGKVLTYGLDANFGVPGDHLNTRFVIWDPKQGADPSAFNTLNMSHPIDSAFCSGMMLLPDGQMLIAGGAIQGDRNAANDLVHLYDYRTGQIKMLGNDSDSMMMDDSNPMMMDNSDNDLVKARWYPTLTTLTDGRILIQGGRDLNKIDGVITPEIYTPGRGSRLLEGATSAEVYTNDRSQWWYPRSWVAPNGQVFGLTGNDMYYIDPEGDGSITLAGKFSEPSRLHGSTAVMYEPGKIMQTGGRKFVTQASIVDLNGVTPAVSSAGETNYPRIWADSTVLPDGTVFVSGGSNGWNVPEGIVYAAEIWNPSDNSWTVVDSAAVPRLYHSTSLLLPDATVLTAGGTTLGFDREALTGEVYRPAYLYDEFGQLAERPTIASHQSVVDWNQTITATVGNATEISRVSLVGFGAVTHSFDMGQRFMELDFTQQGQQLTISTPTSAAVAPPGYYLLFAFDNKGVPSEAQIVQFVV